MQESGPPLSPLEVIAYTGEEGSRFVPGLLGSRMIAGLTRPEDLTNVVDDEGSRTDRYREWVRQYTADRGISVLRSPKGARITSCQKQFLHYYFYVLDPVMGPMSLRVASYLPFNVTCYLNGHSFIAQELTRHLQAELLDSSVDTGELARLAQPSVQGKRRVPGIKLHDDRVIRLMDALLHPGSLVTDWTTKDTHARILGRHRLAQTDYRLSQLRYGLTMLRAKGLVQRIGKTRRYRVTALGLKLGTLLVKLRTRLLGPLCSIADSSPRQRSHHPSTVEAALRQVELSLNNLCQTLGIAA